jgi:NAD(P)-dependent dehydrogenase (short-subunit alcohol dehydrogenase family)
VGRLARPLDDAGAGVTSRVAVVSGGSRGIGRACAEALAAGGWTVAVGYRTREADAKEALDALESAGTPGMAVYLDVTDESSVQEAFRCVQDEAGAVTGLVNNAGYSVTGAIEDVDDQEAQRALETMVLAPMRLARLALPHMRAAGAGRIVNLSSIYGLTTTPLTGWYQASKHAIEALSDALRIEVAKDGIKVVLIEPGGFRTGIWEESSTDIERRRGSRYEGAYQRAESGTRLTQPLMGDPRTVARTIGRALTSRSPRPRYLVGYDAQAIAFWDLVLPAEVKDRLARLSLGL